MQSEMSRESDAPFFYEFISTDSQGEPPIAENAIEPLAEAPATETAEAGPGVAPAEKKKGNIAKVVGSIKQFASFGSLLRLLGTVSMIGALGYFLMDGLETTEHQGRFWTLLGFEGIALAAGLVMSKLFKDQNGARSLVAVSLVSVPACFAVLGALVYSVFPLDGLNTNYPEYLFWQVGSVSELSMSAAVYALMCSVVGFFSFSVLARQARWPLVISLLGNCALLTVPVRETFWVAAVAVLMVSLTAFMLVRYVFPKITVRTFWTNFAITVTALPVMIMTARSVLLYEVSAVVFMAVAAGFYLALAGLHRKVDDGSKSWVEVFLLVAGLLFMFASAKLLYDTQHYAFGDFLWIIKKFDNIIMAGIIAIVMIDLDCRLENRFVAAINRRGFSLVWFVFVAMTVSLTSGIVPVVGVVLAAALLAYGVYRRHNSMMLVSAGVFVVFLFKHHQMIIEQVLSSGIYGALGFGISCVLCAHLLEKHGPAIKARLRFGRKDVPGEDQTFVA